MCTRGGPKPTASQVVDQPHTRYAKGLVKPATVTLAKQLGLPLFVRGSRLHISDFALDWPSSAQWLPKCTSANTPGKCRSIHSSVGPRMQCCRDVTTTKSHVAARRCRLWSAPARQLCWVRPAIRQGDAQPCAAPGRQQRSAPGMGRMPTAKWWDLKNWCTMRLDSSFEQSQICRARVHVSTCKRTEKAAQSGRLGPDLCKFVHLIVADVKFQAVLLVRKLVQAVEEAPQHCASDCCEPAWDLRLPAAQLECAGTTPSSTSTATRKRFLRRALCRGGAGAPAPLPEWSCRKVGRCSAGAAGWRSSLLCAPLETVPKALLACCRFWRSGKHPAACCSCGASTGCTASCLARRRPRKQQAGCVPCHPGAAVPMGRTIAQTALATMPKKWSPAARVPFEGF